MIRQLAEVDNDLRLSLFFQFGNCPAQCNDGSKFHGPSSHVYRSSRRSITLQCSQCGLLWTMTVHQIAKAAKRLADREGACPEARQRFAEAWAEWAEAVDDHRGRRSPRHEHAPSALSSDEGER